MAFQVINESNYVEIKEPVSGLRKTFNKGSHRMDLINDELLVINENTGQISFALKNNVSSITDNVAGTTPTVPSTLGGLLDTLAGFFFRELGEIYDLGALTDGASISVDCKNRSQAKASLVTEETAVAVSVASLGDVFDLSVRKDISDTTTVTLSGDFLSFINLGGSKDDAVTGVNVSLSGTSGSYFEVSLKDSGIDEGDYSVVLIASK